MTKRRTPPFSPDWAFFLDVDGTLLEFASRPHEVHVDAGLVGMLHDLHVATQGAVALVSGRSVDDIDMLFAPLALPVAGQHGTERRTADGAMHRQVPPLEGLAMAAARIVHLTAAHAGLVFENKGMALALHYRLAPALRGLVEREMHALAAGLGDAFELLAGKYVVEIKPSGRDKGGAIAEFISEPPFAGRTPVFIGDDLTDEAGFEVVNRAGGHSVKVGPGPSCARWRLVDAAAVRRWLARHAGRLAAGAAP